MNELSILYPWIKVFHIVSFTAWMAGLFYLPRLFVYHTQQKPGSDSSETFKGMERRLYAQIMMPAMIATYLFGILLLLTPGVVDWRQGWMWSKLVLVLILTVFQLALARWRYDFATDANRHAERFYRIVNEVPTLLLIGIVILVVIKPY
jgi:putative membrane protein